jgi:hypothetical protein
MISDLTSMSTAIYKKGAPRVLSKRSEGSKEIYLLHRKTGSFGRDGSLWTFSPANVTCLPAPVPTEGGAGRRKRRRCEKIEIRARIKSGP